MHGLSTNTVAVVLAIERRKTANDGDADNDNDDDGKKTAISFICFLLLLKKIINVSLSFHSIIIIPVIALMLNFRFAQILFYV